MGPLEKPLERESMNRHHSKERDMPNSQPIITMQGAPSALPPTLLGREPARIPTGGRIRPGAHQKSGRIERGASHL